MRAAPRHVQTKKEKNLSRSYSLSHVSRAWRRTRLQSNIECCVRGLIDLRQYFVLFHSLLRIPLACLQRNDARLIRRFEKNQGQLDGAARARRERHTAHVSHSVQYVRSRTSKKKKEKEKRARKWRTTALGQRFESVPAVKAREKRVRVGCTASRMTRDHWLA